MKNSSSFICMTLSAIALFGCKSKGIPENDVNVSFDSFVDTISAERFFERRTPFVLESRPDALMMPSLIRVIEHDGVYYALDRTKRKVVAFDEKGAIERVVNAVGRSNLEYVTIDDIAWDSQSDRLVLLCQKKLLFVGKDGKIVDYKPIDSNYESFTYVGGTACLVNYTYANKQHEEYSLTILDASGAEDQTLATLPEYAPYCTVNGPSISSMGGTAWYSRMFDHNIYGITEEGECSVVYSIDWAGNEFTPESGKQYECGDLYKNCQDDNKVYMITEFQNGDRYAVFSSNLPGLMVMDKQEKKMYSCKFTYDYPGNACLPNYIPVENSDGLVLFYMGAEYFPFFAEKSGDAVLMEMAGRIGENSNPIFLPYRVK